MKGRNSFVQRLSQDSITRFANFAIGEQKMILVRGGGEPIAQPYAASEPIWQDDRKSYKTLL